MRMNLPFEMVGGMEIGSFIVVAREGKAIDARFAIRETVRRR